VFCEQNIYVLPSYIKTAYKPIATTNIGKCINI